MTRQQIALSIFGLIVSLGSAGLIIFDVWQLLHGGTTISGFMAVRGTLAGFIFGLVVGTTFGLVAGHWWWPINAKDAANRDSLRRRTWDPHD